MPQRCGKVKVTAGGRLAGGGVCGHVQSRSERVSSFSAEWPKFPENKQVLPSYNAILTVRVLLCGGRPTLLSSLRLSISRQNSS